MCRGEEFAIFLVQPERAGLEDVPAEELLVFGM